MNRKFDRFRQWGRERMGGEAKTSLSDDFKAMETEMNVKHDGVDRIHKSMVSYIKSISKRNEGDDKEKTLPIAHVGSSMIAHGEDFDAHSEYGRCLTMLGRTEERLARVQESYINQATSTYIESLERSLAQMKEYQAARKKLDSRRLAYDSSLSKMQKAKREDFRVEEELRSQKIKYEESNDDVYRRMLDIKDTEAENTADISAFLDAQLSYHEKSHEALLHLKNEWPSAHASAQTPNGRRTGRARSITAHSYNDRCEQLQEEPMNVSPPRRIASSNTVELPAKDAFVTEANCQRPDVNRASTFESPTHLRQEPWQLRRTSENHGARRASSQIRPVNRVSSDPYVDSAEETSSYRGTSPGYLPRGRSVSPAPSHGSAMSRTTSSGTLNGVGVNKRAPPPPPPRSKKPPPPPPPMMKKPLVNGHA